jgi:UDP-N-acetylglucosamine transferase subunit ALG13
MQAVNLISDEDLVVQHGCSAPPTNPVVEARPWFTFDELLDNMERATAVVTHAGAGILLCASQLGHIPVVVPRLKRYGETVDDHQVELATAFERTGQVLVAWDVAELPALVAEANTASVRDKTSGAERLCSEVRAALLGNGGEV